MKKGLFKIVVAISVLALAAMACGLAVPGGNDVPSNNTPPTAVSGGDSGGNDIQPTQPPANNGGGSDSGKKILSDNFEGRNSNWGVGDDPDYHVEYVDGALQFKVIATNMKVFSGPNGTDYSNIHMEVDAVSTGSDSDAAFGLLCGQQVINEEFYYAYITSSGLYGIAKSVFIEDDIELTSGTSDLIPQNASSYRVGFDCASDGTLSLYVNGQLVATASDAEYTSGTVGVIAWSGDVDSGTIVSFDNFLITELP